MDDDVEDLVGDVKYIDSQKSITTSAEYSLDFTDSSPERQNSSGKETYVIECDDSDDSEKTFRIHKNESNINLNEMATRSMMAKQDRSHRHKQVWTKDQSVCINLQNCSLFAQESFTQTSKTIIELVQSETHHATESKSLETQTSLLSINENKILEFRVRKVGASSSHNGNALKTYKNDDDDSIPDNRKPYGAVIQNVSKITDKQTIIDYLKDRNNFQKLKLDKVQYENSDDNMIRFIDDEPEGSEHENTSDLDMSKYKSDIEDDSLVENEYHENRDSFSDTSEVLKSVDHYVEKLYDKLIESPLLLSPVASEAPNVRKIGTLTPLTEETMQGKESIEDSTPSAHTLIEPTTDSDSGTHIMNCSGVKMKIFSNNNDITRKQDIFKLPPIQKNHSCPNSPHLNFLFSVNTAPKPFSKSGTLPCLHENDDLSDRWELNRKDLASGESPLICGINDPITSKGHIHLPPIHVEGVIVNNLNIATKSVPSELKKSVMKEGQADAISVKTSIKELKTISTNRTKSKNESRSGSPASLFSHREESRLYGAAERGYDNLCAELIRRLRSTSWLEITETLEDVPITLEKCWSSITENRIADLLRQVTAHVESPRTRVARAACDTLAEILKNTNYTKKPDFYEGISILLTKTGSFSRPVRRAANVALDSIVCHVDITPFVTALCVYGAPHKSALVRGASARLLVVCCALAEGGRQVLRARPPTVAVARQLVLRALAELLHDKNTEARKYAERLYTMLRPLPGFEAYFLTDVDVELATRHMKKFDRVLVNSTRAR